MKPVKAYIVIDNETKEPLLIDERVHVFWLKQIAEQFIKLKWKGLSVKKVLIKEG